MVRSWEWQWGCSNGAPKLQASELQIAILVLLHVGTIALSQDKSTVLNYVLSDFQRPLEWSQDIPWGLSECAELEQEALKGTVESQGWCPEDEVQQRTKDWRVLPFLSFAAPPRPVVE